MSFLKSRGTEYARDLTVKATKWELEFKDKLDSYGVRYIFQHPVICNKKNLYILDFYLPHLNLGIELDGRAHYTPVNMKKDRRRTKCLQREGIRILRIANSVVKSVTQTNLKALLAPYEL